MRMQPKHNQRFSYPVDVECFSASGMQTSQPRLFVESAKSRENAITSHCTHNYAGVWSEILLYLIKGYG